MGWGGPLLQVRRVRRYVGGFVLRGKQSRVGIMTGWSVPGLIGRAVRDLCAVSHPCMNDSKD